MENPIMRGQPTISGGVMLIGLGMLLLTGWWWPGIMLVVGAASASELFLRGRVLAALGMFALFACIPLAIALVNAIDIPWGWLAAFVLMGLGVITIARSTMGGAK